MSYDQTLANKVRNSVSTPTLVEKKAFGGLAFMLNGKMFASVNNRPDHVMMVKIDPENKEVLKRKGAKPAIMRGKVMKGWIFLTEDAIKTEKDFQFWINLALEFNRQSSNKP